MQTAKLTDPQPQPFEFALRIRHPSLDPAIISAELQLEARHSFKAGQPRQPHSNLIPPSYHAESYWLGTLDPAALYKSLSTFDLSAIAGRPVPEIVKERAQALVSGDLDAALAWCSRHLLRAHADFLRRIRTEGGQVHLLVTLASLPPAGFTLTPDVSRMLGELSVALNFEFTPRD